MRLARRALLLVILAVVACGGEEEPVGPAQPIVDAALVGTWVGSIDLPAAQQSGTLTMELNGDGSMSAVVSNPFFKPVDSGTWDVTGDEFEARGRDSAGTLVQFFALRSTTQLDGTFGAVGSPSGTFVVTKQ